MTSCAPATIRPAVASDVPELLALVRELASYERAPEQVLASEEDLAAALFGTPPAAGALVADRDGEMVGMAVYFRTFSTWTGRQGLHLEDVFVRPGERGRGTGRRLLAELARNCLEQGLPRLEWVVLSWNEPALGFYRAIGAEPLTDWQAWRLSGAALDGLARLEP